MEKKTIRIKFVGFWYGFDYQTFPIYKMLTEMYNVELSDTPDYIFYSCFGENNFDELDYDCVRIFYSGENTSPNFNICDYAIGYDDITYNDRFYQSQPFLTEQPLDKAVHKHEGVTEQTLADKTEFCNFVVGNGKGMEERTRIFHLLNEYKNVASVGTYLNNRDGFVVHNVQEKYDFQKKCKFSIAFESVRQRNFITEKIMQAFAAQTVPIYLGDESIGDIFNEKAFIDVQKFGSLEEVVKEVERLDQDAAAYLEMLRQPAFVQQDYTAVRLAGLKEFLRNIFDQPLEKAYRRPRKFIPQRHSDDIKAYLNLKRNVRFQRYLACNDNTLVRLALRLAKPKNTR